MKNFIRNTVNGILAGIMISIGCSVYLACENKVAGAILFSVALLTICYQGYSLYTGKIGFIVNSHTKKDFEVLLTGVLGNVIAMTLCGLALGAAVPVLSANAAVSVAAKLAQPLWSALIRAVFCGVLMYIAVLLFKEKGTTLGIFFCVPVFILAGFEHSIANMGYFAIAGEISFEAFIYIWVVILGNTVGGMLFPLLKLLCKENENG